MSKQVWTTAPETAGDALLALDPEAHPRENTIRMCPYGHDDPTGRGDCRAEAMAMVERLKVLILDRESRGDVSGARYARRHLLRTLNLRFTANERNHIATIS